MKSWKSGTTWGFQVWNFLVHVSTLHYKNISSTSQPKTKACWNLWNVTYVAQHHHHPSRDTTLSFKQISFTITNGTHHIVKPLDVRRGQPKEPTTSSKETTQLTWPSIESPRWKSLVSLRLFSDWTLAERRGRPPSFCSIDRVRLPLLLLLGILEVQ